MTELAGERNAVEVVTVGTAVDWCDVEQNNEERKESARCEEAHDNTDDFAATIKLVEVDEGEECEGEKEAEHEAEQVRVVVDVRQEAHGEECEEEAELLEERSTRMT